MEVSICELEQGEVLVEEEGIIDDFLNCWTNVDEQEKVKPCIVKSNNFDVTTCFVEDEKSFEAIRSMGEYLSEVKNSEVKEDGEYILNKKSSEVLKQKEFDNALIFETVTTQEQFLVKGDEIQSEEMICKVIDEIVEPCNFQIDSLCINAGNISNDEVLMKCHRELELLEYSLRNSEYDNVIAKEGVHYSGQGQKDIIEADGMEERLDNSLMNSVGNSNQHTDVLIVEEKSQQHTDVLPKGDKVQKPYDFYFNKCFMNASLVADVGGNLVKMDNQTKMEEEDFMEEFNPWNRDVQLLERMLESQDSVQ